MKKFGVVMLVGVMLLASTSVVFADGYDIDIDDLPKKCKGRVASGAWELSDSHYGEIYNVENPGLRIYCEDGNEDWYRPEGTKVLPNNNPSLNSSENAPFYDVDPDWGVSVLVPPPYQVDWD